MVKLVVVADDFTGALDTGIKFAEAGAQTQVILSLILEWKKSGQTAKC